MTIRSNTDASAEAAWRLQVVVGDAAPPGLPRRAVQNVVAAAPTRAKAAPAPRPPVAESLSEEPIDGQPPESAADVATKLRPGAEDDSITGPRRLGTMLFRLGRAHAGVLGVVVVVALVFTGSRLMVAQGHEVADLHAAPSLSSAPVSQSAPSPTPSPVLVWVHVMGAVVVPGLVSLPAGARVADAITAAGGLRDDADPGELNLAQPVPDGSQLIIGTLAEPRGELRVSGAGSGGAAGNSGLSGGAQGGPTLNLNTATAAQLETLPGVGPATAAKIIAWREANGGFSRVEELQEVDGIGPKTYAQLAPLVHV